MIAQPPPAPKLPATLHAKRVSLAQAQIPLGELVERIGKAAGIALSVEDDAIAGEMLTVCVTDTPADDLLRALAALDSLGTARLTWTKSAAGYTLVADEKARQIARTTRRRIADALYREFQATAERADRSPEALKAAAQAGDASARRLSGSDAYGGTLREELRLVGSLLKDGTIPTEALLDGGAFAIPVSQLSPEQERFAMTMWRVPRTRPLPDGRAQTLGPPPSTVLVGLRDSGPSPVPLLMIGLGVDGPLGSSESRKELVGDPAFLVQWEERLRGEWQADGASATLALPTGSLRQDAFVESARRAGVPLIAHLPGRIQRWPEASPRPGFLATGNTYPRLMAKRIGSVVAVTSLNWLLNDSREDRTSWKLRQRVDAIALRPGGCATWDDARALVALGTDAELRRYAPRDPLYDFLPAWRPLIERASQDPEFEAALRSEAGAPLSEALLKRLAANRMARLDRPELYRAARRIRLTISGDASPVRFIVDVLNRAGESVTIDGWFSIPQ